MPLRYVTAEFSPLSSSYRAVPARGQEGQLLPPGKLNVCCCFFFNFVFDFAGLFLAAILVRNLYTRDPCEGVRCSLPQTKKRRYGPAIAPCPSQAGGPGPRGTSTSGDT